MLEEGKTLPGMDGATWAPQRSACYEQDCRTGRGYGEALLTMIRERDNPALFGTVVRAITAAGRFEAVEVGFLLGDRHSVGGGLER